MINVYYQVESDYAEVFFKKVIENYGEEDNKNTFLTIFKAQDDDRVVGYGIESVSKKFKSLSFLGTKEKLALMIRVFRMRENYTIDNMAKLLEISEKQYRRLENAETEATVTYLSRPPTLFKGFDLNLLAK